MTLRADALPWVGGTFGATTTGIAPNGLAFALVGLLPQSTPLSLLHPAGQPGSSILVSPDVALLLAAAGGSAQVQLAMPIDPVYVGVQLRSQAVQVEVSGASQIVSISSSNALLLTIGSF